MNRKVLIWIIALILLAMPVFAVDSWTTPVAVYTFDNADLSGNVVIDRGGYQNGTLHNSPTTGVAGIIGEAFDFAPGSQECVNLTDTAKFEGWTGITVSTWVFIDDITAPRPIGMTKHWDGASRGTYLWANHNGATEFSYRQSTNTNNDNDQADTGVAVTTGVWYHIVGTWGADDQNIRLYVNGTATGGPTAQPGATTMTNNEPPTLGCWHSQNLWMDGKQDETYVYNFSFNSTEADWLFKNQSIDGWQPYAPSPGTTDINFTITDDWNTSSINEFSINISWPNGTYQNEHTETGTITLLNVSPTDVTINFTYWNMTDYFNKTVQNRLITANITNSVTNTTYQAELCINATAKVNEAWATPDNVTIGSDVSTSCFNITAGNHNVMAQKAGWYNRNQTFNIPALSNTTQTIVNMSYANLTIYAIDGTTNESLSNYDIYINSISTPTFYETASGVTNHSFYLINDTYNVTIDVPGYAVTTSLANVSVSGHTNHTFVLYSSNSVTITIRDEITNDLITENITVRWSDNSSTWENVTDTGGLFVSNISAGNYTLLFYGSNYSTRSYSISVANDSTQFLTAYMISSTYSTIFTMKDIDTGVILADVSITMYKLINSTWTTVESKLSDISGKAQFAYDPIANYRFFLSKSEYDDYVFYLNPILFSTYDVFLTKSAVLNYSVDYDDISIIYSPDSAENEQNTSFAFLISSPGGQLTTYSMTLTYPGGTSTASGVNAIGEQLSGWLNITGATRWDTIKLDYNYTTTISGERTFTQYLEIITNATASENTFMANKDRTFGLGIFERMLIVTIIIIFTVGIATMVGQPLPGVAIGLFMYGFLVFTGFIPIWVILPSMLIGFLFLVWKSGGL